MSDIVDRLRAMAGPIVPNVCTEAADEIERLTRERDEARLAYCRDTVDLYRLKPAEIACRNGWEDIGNMLWGSPNSSPNRSEVAK